MLRLSPDDALIPSMTFSTVGGLRIEYTIYEGDPMCQLSSARNTKMIGYE